MRNGILHRSLQRQADLARCCQFFQAFLDRVGDRMLISQWFRTQVRLEQAYQAVALAQCFAGEAGIENSKFRLDLLDLFPLLQFLLHHALHLTTLGTGLFHLLIPILQFLFQFGDLVDVWLQARDVHLVALDLLLHLGEALLQQIE